jgi:hypothetical protein
VALTSAAGFRRSHSAGVVPHTARIRMLAVSFPISLKIQALK